MKKITVIMSLMLGMLMMTGCVAPSAGTKTTVTSGQGSPTIDQAQAERYDGPKARVAVSQFKNKTGSGGVWYNPQIGNGMADQLTTALFNSNRFIVLEREILGDVLTEQDLGASGRIKQETAAAIGEIEGAELLIVGAVTEFSGNASGSRGGLGGFGGGIFGAIAGGFKKAHMAIDIRVVDARTSRVLAATSVEGEATDVNLGGLIGGYGGIGGLAGGLSGWKNTPIEKALRICIQRAVEFVVSKTPQKYYHYGVTATKEDIKKVEESPVVETATVSEEPTEIQVNKEVVMKMQSYLASLGYNVGTIDGIPGKKTKVAVSDFQTKHNLKSTGVLTPATMKKIREEAIGN